MRVAASIAITVAVTGCSFMQSHPARTGPAGAPVADRESCSIAPAVADLTIGSTLAIFGGWALSAGSLDRLQGDNPDGGGGSPAIIGLPALLVSAIFLGAAVYGAETASACMRTTGRVASRRRLGYATTAVAAGFDTDRTAVSPDDGGHRIFGFGSTNRALVVEGGLTVGSLPVWAHVSAGFGHSTKSYDEGATLLRLRGGPELRSCNETRCLILGVDVGYQRQRFLASLAYQSIDNGPTVGPRVAFELGTGVMRVHAALAIDGYHRYISWAEDYPEPHLVSVDPVWTKSFMGLLGVTFQPECSRP